MHRFNLNLYTCSTQWEWNKGTIVIKSPERPAGQESVIGLTVPKMNVVRVGFVGLGMRGPGAVERFTHIAGTKIVALCDYEKERAEKCQKYLQKACLPEAAVYSGAEGYKALCRLGSPLPDCQVCHGAWKERSHRSSIGYESGTVLGTYQPV